MAFRFKKNLVANSNFSLQVGETGCCPEDGVDVCKYSVNFEADGTTITGITFEDSDGNSVTKTLTTPVDEDDPTAINKALTELFYDNGLITDGVAPDIYVFTEDLAGTVYTTIEIYAANVFTNLVRTSDPTNAIEQECAKTLACRYETEIDEGADIDLVIDDLILQDPQSIANLDATGSVDSPLVADAVHTALAALYSDKFKRVKVTYNSTTSKYKIQFWLRGTQSPTFDVEAAGAEEIAVCECIRDFEA